MKHISEILPAALKEFGITTNQVNEMIVMKQPNEIDMYRMCALKAALKLEVLGMKRRGRSVYMIVKEEFGFKGSKAKVLEQLEEVINQRK